MNKVAKFCFGWALLGFGGGTSPPILPTLFYITPRLILVAR